jgi:Major Facilitator Superfamily
VRTAKSGLDSRHVEAKSGFELALIRGELEAIIGVLPAFAIVYLRIHVKEPEVWLENRRRQRAEGREVKAPLFSIFKPAILGNTAGACWWMASSFVVPYSITAMFATWLPKNLQLSPGLVALPVMLLSIGQFGSGIAWSWVADRLGRRWAMILPALIGAPLVSLYLFTHNYAMIVVFFGLQGWFAGGGIWSQAPSYLSERFPTECAQRPPGFAITRGDPGRLCRAGCDLFRDQLASGVCAADSDRDEEAHRGEQAAFCFGDDLEKIVGSGSRRRIAISAELSMTITPADHSRRKGPYPSVMCGLAAGRRCAD